MRKPRKQAHLAIKIVAAMLLGVLTLGGAFYASMQSQSDLLAIGQAAPDFVAQTSEGNRVRLSELRERKRVVLVFYPGDETPLCTAQLCALRDNWDALQREGASVFGVNPANKERHHDFAVKNRLPFPLLIDTQEEIAKRYGCRALFGIIKRTVYILDRHGVVVWARRGAPSASEILGVLKTLKEKPIP